MAKQKSAARRKGAPGNRNARRQKPRSRAGAWPAWLRRLPGGVTLFALGIVLGLALGLMVTALVPNLLEEPERRTAVAEGAAKLPKKSPARAEAKKPDYVEKMVPPPAPLPAPEAVPAPAEESAHQSASVTAPPPDQPAENQVASLPGPSAKEPALPQWLEYSVAARDPGNSPMITIVLDDVGVAPQHAEMAIALPAPIVISVMTYARNAAALARTARAKGHEIMVHMPMQPVNASINPGPNALAVGMEADELRRRIDWGLGRLDGYVGFNNHMGSRFTQDAGGMSIVLEEARKRGLLFLDSKTIAGSVGDSLAARMGVTHIARDVFLDDDMSETAVARQLAEAERIARKQGYAVAIGHPHPATIAVLKRWLPEAKRRGFAIVPLTTIVKKREGVAG
ncbi:divergent polysaccharide deacetylase family protein [Dongia sp.]|uniref:divergent polysaccharide deacetylase family protein n=1 Tax=Dongia sp. TaxID=1977262 RepID=UPI0035B06A65